MRIATYNVEWFTNLFDATNRLLAHDHSPARAGLTKARQIAALGHVFTEMDADLVMVVEAPNTAGSRSTLRALEGFAQHFGLRANKAIMGFVNDTEQELAVLYDPDKLQAHHVPGDAEDAPRFDRTFQIDLNHDGVTEAVTFSKPPLELALRTKQGSDFHLIGVHIKSKAPHGARTQKQITRLSIENRRKALAQSVWLRRRVESQLAKGDSLVVLGDFNDGPGLDDYEALFGRSSIEIVLGEGEGARLFDPHAQMTLSRRTGAKPMSSRFFLAHEGRYLQALLDYVMVSQDLKKQKARWRILHPFDDARCFGNVDLRNALLDASDHFPVLLDLEI